MVQLSLLLVEPDAGAAASLRACLGKSGFVLDVLHVRDAEEAVARLSGDASFAEAAGLILLALKQPGMSGISFLEWLKTRPELRRIPVVVLSATRANPDIWRAYGMGANSYLLKPPAEDELLHLVDGIAAYWSVLKTPPGG